MENELQSTIKCYMNDFCFFNSTSGYHYIGTGMNYFGMDVKDQKMPIPVQNCLRRRDIEIKQWNKACKGKLSLLKFLKTNIHQ